MTDDCSKPQKKTLNVIFQGLILFFQNSDAKKNPTSITALIPNLGPEHAYRAGNWLSEISLAPGDYQLAGVDPGTGQFNPSDHTILPCAGLRPILTQHELFVRLELPQPRRIASFRTVRIPRSALVSDACLPKPSDLPCMNVANTHIFTYDVSDGVQLHDVRLAEIGSDSKNIAAKHPWAPDADYCSTIANLHILASPETRPRVPHVVDEFHLAASLLHDIELQLKENLPNLPPLPSQEEIRCKKVHGVIQAELEDLSSRNIRLGEMGRVIRRRIHDCGYVDIGSIWSVIDELSEPLACTAPGAGDGGNP